LPGSVKSSSTFINPGANSRSSQQEGEELIVGELAGGGVGSAAIAKAAAGGQKGVLERDSRPSMFAADDEGETNEPLPTSAFTYASSSDDEEGSRKKRIFDKQRSRFRGQLPTRLPFPAPPGTVEVKSEDTLMSNEANTVPVMEHDPPLVSPFAKLTLANDDSKGKLSHAKWMVFKFPTRLPRVDPKCMGGASSLRHRLGANMDNHDNDAVMPDAAISDPTTEVTEEDPSAMNAAAAQAGGGAEATLYDDTLKDVAPGRYGTLKVYKSGKTELVIGSPNGRHVTMQVMEGVRPSFYQQAVVMDMEASKFVPLGDVKRSVVVIPSLERVFS